MPKITIKSYSLLTLQPFEIFVDDENKLTLNGLQQYYFKLTEREKNRKLNDILDMLQFNQVIIFVRNIMRCSELNKLLMEFNFPSIAIHGQLDQEERYTFYSNVSKNLEVQDI